MDFQSNQAELHMEDATTPTEGGKMAAGYVMKRPPTKAKELGKLRGGDWKRWFEVYIILKTVRLLGNPRAFRI